MSHWGPMGIHLGYPVCCVREFCDHIKHDRMPGRIAGNGPWSGTGFIPCAAHRAQILAGVSVESLITNRRSRHAFPESSMAEADEFMRAWRLIVGVYDDENAANTAMGFLREAGFEGGIRSVS